MAKLIVSQELLLQALFPDQHWLELLGASYEWRTRTLTLELQGPTVPDVPEVIALITVKSHETTFKPREL